MTSGAKSKPPDKEIPAVLIGTVLEDLCRAHLDRTQPFPPEYLDYLCKVFLGFADLLRTQIKPQSAGVRAAHAADALTYLGVSKTDARKLAAERVGIATETVRQNQKRLRKRRGTK
jgi:hypothetical protein